MKELKIETTTKVDTKVTLDGLDIDDVLDKAAELAHCVLEELSIYRQEHDMDTIEEGFECEGLACEFLDLIDD